jgi:predicted phosphodiesterase
MILTFIPLIPANAASAGLTFTADTIYTPSKTYSESLNTFAAIVNFPTTMNPSTRGGIIFGNFGQSNPVVNFEVHANGSPRLFITDASGNVTDLNFRQVNLYNGKDTHVAIVRDAKNAKAYCYIDGELKQTLSCGYTADIKLASPLMFGGDVRSANEQYFKGSLISAAIYSTARSAGTIKSDYESDIPYDYDMVCGYRASALENNVIPDRSANGYDLRLEQTWFTEKEPVTDYAYSFAIVGDTQIVAKHHPDKFHKIYDYIVDNIENKKIKFVMGLGDITDGDSNAEWNVATENIFKLDGKVGYSVVRGNHDSKTKFNAAFPTSKYENIIGGSFDGTMLNTWQELIVGDVKYLIFTFDYGYEDNYTNMFPLAKKYNVKVTIYMIGYKIDKPGYLTREQIKEMSDSGLVQFGSHTLDHPSLIRLSEQGVREQFSGTSWLISEITGKPVTTVAYPSGDYNDMVMEVAREFYSFAYTTDDDWYWGQDAMMLPRYAVPRGTSAATVLYFIG